MLRIEVDARYPHVALDVIAVQLEMLRDLFVCAAGDGLDLTGNALAGVTMTLRAITDALGEVAEVLPVDLDDCSRRAA